MIMQPHPPRHHSDHFVCKQEPRAGSLLPRAAIAHDAALPSSVAASQSVPSVFPFASVEMSKPLLPSLLYSSRPWLHESPPSPFTGNNKCALSFILSSSSEGEEDMEDQIAPSLVPAHRKRTIAKRRRLEQPMVIKQEPCTTITPENTSRSAPHMTKAGKKGSKFCIVDGCMSRAKHAKRCWKHGGSVKCKIPDCINRAKSKGVCWSHGGGTSCSFEGCDTISVSNGFCWAHGGGKRCIIPHCSKPAYERTKNYCTTHYQQHCVAN